MYVTTDKFEETYSEIHASSVSHSACKLVIIVSCLDIDALCASRLFSRLCKRDLIPHKISPVAGYSELRQVYQSLSDEVTNVVMLGCGALVDLEIYLRSQEEEKTEAGLNGRKIYIFDSHRPWNLENLLGSSDVICFDNELIEDDLKDQKDAFVGLHQMGDMSSDEDDDEDEDDDNEIDGASDEDNDTDNDNATDDDNDHLSEGRRKRKSPSSERNDRRKRRADKRLYQKYQKTINEYYANGHSIASSVSSQLYTLVSMLGETSNDSLWLAIVGTASLETICPETCRKLYPLFRDEAERLNPELNGSTNIADDYSIHEELDYRLFLLRHWSLYESSIHSTYLCTRMMLWSDDGKKRLHKMLAKMGISLREAKQKWTHMDVKIKRDLKKRFESVVEIYGIDELIRPSLVRRFGFQGLLAADDCAQALGALLEHGPFQKLGELKKNTQADDKDDENENHIVKDSKYSEWVENFWVGWDALDSFQLLKKGLQIAFDLQRAIVRTGTVLFERRQIRKLRVFRLAVIKDGPDLEVFTNPIALMHLASWINDGCAEIDSLSLPLVVASMDPSADTYLVVGMVPSAAWLAGGEDEARLNTESTSNSGKNAFGVAFQQVAQETRSRVRIDSFDSSIVEIRCDDLAGFLEALTLSGLL